MVDLEKELPSRINLLKKDGFLIRSQEVVYKNLPNSCFLCGRAGHRVKECLLKKPKEVPLKETKKWMPKNNTPKEEEIFSEVKEDDKEGFSSPKRSSPSRVSRRSKENSNFQVSNNPFDALREEGVDKESDNSMEIDIVPVTQDVGVELLMQSDNYSKKKSSSTEEVTQQAIGKTMESESSMKKYKRRLSLGVRKSLININPGGKKPMITNSESSDKSEDEDSPRLKWKDELREEVLRADYSLLDEQEPVVHMEEGEAAGNGRTNE